MRNDARRSFRIQLPEPQQRGVFMLGKQRFPVLMLNASAVGFAFLSPKPIGVAIGTAARLQADDAWYEVLVVRTEQTAEGSLLGVERVADINGPEGPSTGPKWLRTTGSDARSNASTALVVAGVALCALLSAYLIAGRPTLDALRSTLMQSTPETAFCPFPLPEIAAIGDDSTAPAALVRVVAIQSPELSSQRDAWTIAARQEQLLADETATLLHLSELQKRQISRLLQARAPMLAAGGDRWEQVRQDESRLLQILTPKQISQWRSQPLQ